MTPSAPRKRRRLAIGLGVLGTVLVLGYVGAYVAAGDDLPADARVAGVKIGGLSPEKAKSTLEQRLGKRLARPVAVTVGRQTKTFNTAITDTAVDYAASVEAAGAGRSWSPVSLWRHYTGGESVEAVFEDNGGKLRTAMTELGQAAGKAPVNGAVKFRKGKVRVTNPEPGQSIDLDSATDEVHRGWLSKSGAVTLPLVPVEPEITRADVDKAVSEIAEPAVSGPVTIELDQTPIKLKPREIGRVLALIPRDGVLVAQLKDKAFADVISSKIGEDGAPVDATVRLVNGRPQVIPAKPGVKLEASQISDRFVEAVQKSGDQRTLSVDKQVANADFSTKDAEKLGIKEKISSFTTEFPYAEYRNINIGRAAELVNGTLLKPGETFSLNETVGERTAENGFTTGFMISNGIFKEDYGGGVSQMATTAFNAGFFGGMTDVEHKPHSFYISRYPVGREATVAWPSLDMAWKNDTPYGVLIQSSLKRATPGTQGAVTVTLWSTKYWDITEKTGQRYNFTSPATRTLTTADCVPNSGYGGFDINVWRYWRKHGSDELVRTEKFHTTYTPSDTVICKKPEPKKKPKPSN